MFSTVWNWVLANKGKVISAAAILAGGGGTAATYALSPEAQAKINAVLALIN